ncbi:hypothetical protein TNCV_4794541 [Trichonephila clavipes]|nr:hypothetical protein TNCV_4794541 [Trichonephila clavipes]
MEKILHFGTVSPTNLKFGKHIFFLNRDRLKMGFAEVDSGGEVIGDVLGTTTECISVTIRLSYTISISAVPRLIVNLSQYLGKWVKKDNFHHDWRSRNIPFSTTYRKSAWRNPSKPQEFHAALLSDLLDDFLAVTSNTCCCTTI